MGAWGYDPFEDDVAQEWLLNTVESPILRAIADALNQFLEDGSDDVRKTEAEAAVALLLDLTSEPSGFRYVRFNINYFAREGLWDLSTMAITRLRSDQKWLEGYSDPQKKVDVLTGLLNAVEASKGRSSNAGGSAT
jgi:hypothetical protein